MKDELGIEDPDKRLITPDEFHKLLADYEKNPDQVWTQISNNEITKKKLAKWLVEVALTQRDGGQVNQFMVKDGGSIETLLSPNDEAKACFDFLNSYGHWRASVIALNQDVLAADTVSALTAPREYTHIKGRKKRAGPTDEGMRVYRLALEFFTELREMQVYEEDLMEACTQYWMNESEYYKMIKRRGQYRKKSSSTTSMEEVGEAGELDADLLQDFDVPVDPDDHGK